MRSEILITIVAIPVLVAVCVVLSKALKRKVALGPDLPAQIQPRIDSAALTQYRRLVRSTLGWFDHRGFPITRFTRAILDRVVPPEGDGQASDDEAVERHHQDLGQVALQPPPPVHY
ncbi:hypothetical protein FRC04_009084 [Tulasnella sp. 424]|nr:hypothetical protein FRC04_009084 [Tulasnella sp. 424]